MTTNAMTSRVPEVLGPGAGHQLHFLDDDATVKVSPGPDGALSVVEFTARHGFGPPTHQHRDEDELFLVLDGELDFFTGDRRIAAIAGSTAYLPRDVPHTFQVVSQEARFVCVTASVAGPPRFDAMIRSAAAAGESLDDALLRDICEDHGIQHLGRRPPLPVRSATSLADF